LFEFFSKLPGLGYHHYMSAEYRQHAPPECLRSAVECFWTVETQESIPEYPVLPDGCLDFVYSPSAGLQIVGAMTHARNFKLASGERQFGVRFRPGMALGFAGAPGSETIDQVLPLENFWGAKGRRLADQIADAKSSTQAFALFEAQLVDPSEPDLVQQVAAYIVDRSGQARVDDLAFQAGMSARQLRRLFVEQIGLTPKHFCRVIRFQHSLARMRETGRGDLTNVALDCGYYDQAHFINEFREFSGFSPTEFAARPR
jgi:AraC-like DNA-binding protein